MTHTQERLVLTSQDDFPTGTANFESRYGVDAIVLYHDNSKADARRIVQCWNQHDELLATLKDMVALVEWAMSDEPDEPTHIDGAAVLERARAAIAGVKGLGE
jgi:hypothetical protein